MASFITLHFTLCHIQDLNRMPIDCYPTYFYVPKPVNILETPDLNLHRTLFEPLAQTQPVTQNPYTPSDSAVRCEGKQGTAPNPSEKPGNPPLAHRTALKTYATHRVNSIQTSQH
jgi:hypothetical protein